MKILIIEDDYEISKLAKLYLEKEGYEIISTYNANDGIKKFYEENPNLIILDLMLPDFPGINVLEELKKEKDIPVIIITAKGEEDDRIIGFKKGADDYITKPFSFKELVLRVKAVLKRYGDSEFFKFKDLEIYSTKFKIYKNKEEIKLSSLEFKIFMALYKNKGRVMSRDDILDSIYGFYGEPVIDRSIDVHITNLRKKLNDNPKNPKYIETVRGVGYRLVEDEN
ncbi:MAG: response regulator transcription factor [Caldisericia bacterium]|jgi:two-component system alkaline phosphatase synthesis response regulator PhoP|nr:response regulator transcription factor [Caldisericia bacterium]